jgi:hypothetical protein
MIYCAMTKSEFPSPLFRNNRDTSPAPAAQDLFKDGTNPKDMDITTAFIVLRDIVATPETSITDMRNISRFGGHSTQEIRDALETVGQHLLNNNQGSDMKAQDRNRNYIEKPVAECFLALGIDDGQVFPNGKQTAPSISLQLYRKLSPEERDMELESYLCEKLRLTAEEQENMYGKETYISTGYPLKDETTFLGKNSLGYSDRRGELRARGWVRALTAEHFGESVTLYEFFEDPDIDKYHFLMRGVRWLAANMLNWNTEKMILPEDVGRQSTIKQLPATY